MPSRVTVLQPPYNSAFLDELRVDTAAGSDQAPLTTMSTLRLPHCEQRSRVRQSGTVIAAPYRSAISAGSASTRCLQSRHHTISRKCAAAVLPSVAGGPGC